MQVQGYYLDEKDMSLKEIEQFIEHHIWESERYSKHDLEINIDNDEGKLSIWLDDHDWEEHLMTITPTKEDLKLIDQNGICGEYPSRNFRCPLGLGSYDWVLRRNTCDCCRKCFNFKL